MAFEIEHYYNRTKYSINFTKSFFMMQRADYSTLMPIAMTCKKRFLSSYRCLAVSLYAQHNNKWDMNLFSSFHFIFFIPKFNLKSRQKLKWFHLRINSVRWSLNLWNGKHNYSSGEWNHFPRIDNNDSTLFGSAMLMSWLSLFRFNDCVRCTYNRIFHNSMTNPSETKMKCSTINLWFRKTIWKRSK